nr:MAG TPA: Photosystem II protein D1, Photosystem II, photosynthesis, PSII, membrane [Caudoviricetes sp.]
MLSPPRLPASWVGFNAGVSEVPNRASAGAGW